MRIETTSIAGIVGGIAIAAWETLFWAAPASTDNSFYQAQTSLPGAVRKAGDVERSTQSDKATASEKESAAPSDAHEALQKKVDLLKKGRAFIESKQDYTANLDKREVVNGELLDEQSMQLKCRQKPFSIYLHWTAGDVGREVIYVEGANDGKLIAHDGGWKARLGAFNLEPSCKLATKDSRYPITCAGLICLIDTMLEVHDQDLQKSNVETCQFSEQQFDGRPCVAVTTKYQSKDVSDTYRKSVTLFDRESAVLLSTEHFEWPKHGSPKNERELDEATLIEKYAFRNLAFDQHLTDKDFDQSNKDYAFR